MLAVFGYPYTIELATRPDNALGDPADWDLAVKTLAEVLTARGQPFTYDEGGGAFYGPKLDFKLIDAIGRKWQGPTVQLDFNLPERFQLEYIGADNAAHRPVMLHRVLVGSMERFVGGLIEHYAGAFPLWLAPEQISVIPITPDVGPAAAELAHKLQEAGIRVGFDAENREDYRERIKTASKMKVPYMAIIGKREAEAGTVALRFRGSEKKQEIISVSALIERLKTEIATRALEPAGALQPLETGL
jgi:threonyl-tRNA synthetase